MEEGLLFSRRLTAALLACSLWAPVSASAQLIQDEEQDDSGAAIVVTGSLRVRQGGAQDIEHFRSMAVTEQTLPRPESLSLEGLLGEHDLTLPAARGCKQLFCLNTQAIAANLPTRPEDLLFVGLGFDSNIDADSWQREPISIMAVVDRSGSMSGPPIDNVKAALHQLVDELGDKDRMGITIYGTTSLVHQASIAVAGHKSDLHAAIDTIQIDGSTSMEAGLQMGYDAAFAEAGRFDGNVRMILFTDEQPNTGRTDAASFMSMAQKASQRGIGLTTIGVGVQYGGALATKVSSVRGGNLFFITDTADAQKLFVDQFRDMVSEVAHDIAMTMTPRAGYRISGIYGVPDGLMTEGKDGAMTITVPTAFLSSNGGGIFASLAKAKDRAQLPVASLSDGLPLMDVSLSYTSALDGKAGHDAVIVANPVAVPADNLRLAQALVDEYLVMDQASRAYHEKGDAKAAFALLDGLHGRLTGLNLAGLDSERTLVGTMRGKAAVFAGYGGELPKELRPTQVIGKWRVVSLRGVDDLSRGDTVEFTTGQQMVTYLQRPLRGEDELYQGYEINEKEIYVRDGDLLVNYALDGDQLRLTSRDGQVRIVLARAVAVEEVS